MKIAYIGAPDGLAEALVERLEQEGNDVYLIADKALPRSRKRVTPHRFYRIPSRGDSYEKLLRSISPDCVIFAGDCGMSSCSTEQTEKNVTLLARTLRAVSTIRNVKFILLSSIDVYGNTEGKVRENGARVPVSERGLLFAREEDLVRLYRQRYNMDTVILRVSQLYTSNPKSGDGDILSQSFDAADSLHATLPAGIYQPLHVSDLADAVKRVIDSGRRSVYNVSGSSEVPAEEIVQLARQQEDFPRHPVQWEDPTSIALADSQLISSDLGWYPFRKLEEQLKAGSEIAYDRAAAKERKDSTRRSLPDNIRQLIINLVVFAAFFGIDFICRASGAFPEINWMLIYVVLIAATCDLYQGILAIVLASCVYLFGQAPGILEAGTFYAYARVTLAILQFAFVGLLVSYMIRTMRQEVRSANAETSILREEYEDLRSINDENVLIKNEYEDRLLSSKTGFPKFYSLISRLMVQEHDRILMETMQVVSELFRTDTVAVYQGEVGSPWLRLVGALNDASAMEGKTWNLADSPQIYKAIEHDELYQGAIGSDEPAVVLPVVSGNVVAVVLIKKLPYESNSLHATNMLKTLSLLLRDTLGKALQYEQMSRAEHYVEGTDILKPAAFRDRIRIAQEKADKGLAEFCIVELVCPGPPEKSAALMSKILRGTDYLGTDANGKLYALLNNTVPANLVHLQNRLKSSGADVRLVAYDSLPDDEDVQDSQDHDI